MINGGNRVRCRMYHSFQETYRGFTKNLFAGFGYKILKFALVWLWLGIAFLEPVVVLIVGSVAGLSGLSMIIATISVVVAAMIWGADHRCFGFPLYLTLLYPVSMVLVLTIAAGSLIFALTGRADWKGRTFAKQEVKWW